MVALSGAVLALTLLHDADHMRQGRDLPTTLNVIGIVAPLLALAVLIGVARGWRGGTIAATGFGFLTALGLIAIHVLPSWSAISDPYGEANVDAASWLSLIALIVASTALGVAGSKDLGLDRSR